MRCRSTASTSWSRWSGRQGLAWLPSRVAARRVAWTIPDPYGNDLATYLAVARTIEERVRALVDGLLARELPAR